MSVHVLLIAMALAGAAGATPGPAAGWTRGFAAPAAQARSGFAGVGAMPGLTLATADDRAPAPGALPSTGSAKRGFIVDIEELLAGATASLRPPPQEDGTATALRARREAKRAELAPPRQGGVEAALAWLEDGHWLPRIRAGWHGALPTMGGFPSGSGQAFGVAWKKTGLGVRYPSDGTPNRLDMRSWAAFSLRGYLLGLFEASLHRLGGTPVHVSTHVGWQRNAGESFYGIGPDTLREDRTDYKVDVGAVGAVAWWRRPDWFYTGAGVSYRNYSIGPGDDPRFPGTPDIFPVGQVPGLDKQGGFTIYDAFVQVDWRNEGNAYRGGLYAVRWSHWGDPDFGEFEHDDFDIELQQYFPFLMNQRVIALRARTILTDPEAGNMVPFYLMPRLGGSRELRGFKYGRFTDNNMLSLSAEYRAEIWMAMDLALFVDAGKVFADRGDLDFHDLRTDYGFGLRVKTTQSTFLRSDIAFGGEGVRVYITFDNAFDSTPLFARILRTVR